MCGYKARFWARYQQHWLRDKLEAAEHTIESQEAELARYARFIAEENKRAPGMITRWVNSEIAHA